MIDLWKGARLLAAHAVPPMSFIWHTAAPREQITGSINLLIMLAFFLFFGRYAEIPDDGRYGGDLSVTSQFMPVGDLVQGREVTAEIRQQVKVSYSFDGIATSATTAHTPKLLESLRRREGDKERALASGFASPDCRGLVPTGHTRIFIAYRADTKSGTGSASDPFDGSSAQKFDTLLRSRSESGVTNLVVCIGPGTFQTEGARDYLLGQGHLDKAHPAGFTVNQGWRIHGAGVDQTILQLAGLYLDPSSGKYLSGLILGTYDLGSYGIEVSDLTLDDNYPALKSRYKTKLQLQAIFIQSNRGRHWIHHIHVMNPAGELAEDFPIEIGSPAPSPTESTGTIVEYATLDHWGGGECTAIAIANSVSEVRYNTVIGYWGGYGGWQMSDVNFHDNSAIGTVYGFNVDSLHNKDVVITHNQIVHPQRYGIVIGGIGQFINFTISDNTITLAVAVRGSSLFGFILQSNVSGARLTGNRIITDQSPPPTNVVAVYEKGDHNADNVFQANQISDSFRISLRSAICAYGNVNQNGAAFSRLDNTQKTPCLPER